MRRCLLFVHAHPDDESSKGAATAARYADEGTRVVLVTATGGEAGDVLNPSHPAVDPPTMGETRARELKAATAAIGFDAVHLMGYRDSGYHDHRDDVPEGCFARVPVAEAGTRLAGILRRERPQVVVTYPEGGGYPHPDHIHVHDVTMHAVDVAADAGRDDVDGDPWQVRKLYSAVTFSPERVQVLHEAMVERGEESPFQRWLDRQSEQGWTPPRIDARIRVDEWFENRDRALRAHATQIDPDGFWFAVPRVLERELYPYEAFTLLHSDVATDLPESDLFAGLDAAD